MDKRILIVVLLMVSVSAFGQQKKENQSPVKIKPSNHELNVGVMNLFGTLPKVEVNTAYMKSITSANMKEYTPPGFTLGYKYHFGLSAIRSGFGLAFYSAETANDDPKLKESFSSYSFFAGYQYEYRFHRSAIYFGLDALYELQNSEYIHDQKPAYYAKTTKEHSAFGGRPFLGVRFFINEHISLSTETQFYMRWYILDSRTVDAAGETKEKQKIEGSIMEFGPLGTVSINFHL